jgi:hypothetical protein
MAFTQKALGVGEATDWFPLIGKCDIWVNGLLAGSVKLQFLFQGDLTPYDVPDGEFTADTFKTIFVSDEEIRGRLIGVGNTDGVIARLSRFKNG